MNEGKVVIPRKVAEAIEELKAEGCSNFDILNRAHGEQFREPDLTIRHWAFYGQGGSPDELMRALVNGYEIECTPHEKLREFYEGHWGHGRKDAFHTGVIFGIARTLEILGITVEGINDDPTGSDREWTS